MRKILSVLLLLALAACGGGEVNCVGEYSCTQIINGGTNTVSVPGLTVAPGGSASSPSGGASSPNGTPAATIPLAAIHQLPPTFTITAGDMRFSAGGVTYVVGVADIGDGTTWVGVWSLPQVNSAGEAGTQVATIEVQLDSGTETHGLTADDSTLKAYVSAIVVPRLDAWMQANSSRWASGMVVYAVNTKDSPTGDSLTRLAGRLPQWVDITPFGATVK